MEIKLNEPIKIGNKFYTTDTTMNVTNDLGMRLVVAGQAYCTDGTFGAGLNVEPAKPIKKEKKKVEPQPETVEQQPETIE